MKKLFKFIFGLIIFIIVLALVLVGGTIYLISDKTDEAPVELYDETLTTETLLAKEINSGFDAMGTTYDLDIIFDEDTLNQLIYTFIKKSLNTSYNPNKANATNDELYAFNFTIPTDIPVVGGKPMGVKHIYGEINQETEEVTINLTATVAEKIKSRLYFSFKVETRTDDYLLTITEIKFGKLDLDGNLVKKALEAASIDGTVNDAIKNTNLPFTFDSSAFTLTATKEGFSNWVKDLLATDDSSSAMTSTFLNLFLDPANDMVKFGMFTKGFGIELDLEALRVDESKTTLDPQVTQPFDTDQVISGKAQALVINSLSNPTADKYLSFTEMDFSQLIYNQMNAYDSLKINQEIITGVTFNFSVDGITFDIDDKGENLAINVILNVNGLKTTAVLNGKIDQVSDEEVKIVLADTIALGANLTIDSGFMTEMLSSSFSDDSIMKFDSATNSFVFTAELFNSFLKEAMGSSNSPMKVSKLAFEKDCLKIFVTYTDMTLQDNMNKVTDLINGCLKDGITLDTSKYSEADAATVAKVQEELTNISEKLTSGSLTEEDTDSLLEQVGEMSAESQAAFYEQITSSVGDKDADALEELYKSMFK